jgi:parvulin-like peptidyl-prolyl isomerase
VVISVGEENLTAADVELIIQAFPPQQRALYGGVGRHLLPQYLVQMKILAAEARKQNLEQQAEVQKAIELTSESILATAARRHLEESIPVSEEQLQQLYQEREADFEEVRIRQILIRIEGSVSLQAGAPSRPPLPEAEARKKLQDLREQILAGADFAEMAQAHSENLATAGDGGDMGFINRLKVVPPVANAAYQLAPGEVSDIIRTPYGLELIAVEERRVKPLAEVRSQLEAELRRGQVEKMMKDLIEQYEVKVDTPYFQGQPTAPKAADSPPR